LNDSNEQIQALNERADREWGVWQLFQKQLKLSNLLAPLNQLLKVAFPGIVLADVHNKGRQKRVVAARNACWRLQYERGFSTVEIADMWGRDHTTILHALKRTGVQRRKRKERDRLQLLENLVLLIGSRVAHLQDKHVSVIAGESLRMQIENYKKMAKQLEKANKA
jgi:hypothetical protein